VQVQPQNFDLMKIPTKSLKILAKSVEILGKYVNTFAKSLYVLWFNKKWHAESMCRLFYFGGNDVL